MFSKSLALWTAILLVTMVAGVAQAATILNSTTFDGTEPFSDGNASGAEDPGSGSYDTYNGWTWGTDYFAPGGGGTGSGDYTGTLFAGLGESTVDTVPSRPIEDQLIRVVSSPSLGELTSAGEFSMEWGNASNTDNALAQAFSLSNLQDVTVTYDVTSILDQGGAYIYVDDGSGLWTPRAHAVASGVNTFTFTPTGADIRIAFVNNDGADPNTHMTSVEVSQVIPEPGSLALLGLGGLLIAGRRRRRN